MIAPALIWSYSKAYACWQVTMSDRPMDVFANVRERVGGTGWLIVLMYKQLPRTSAVVGNYFFAQKMLERWTAVNWKKVPPKPWPTIDVPKSSRADKLLSRAERD